MKNSLREKINARLSEKADVEHYLYGVLGNGSTVEVPGRPGYVYVSLDDGQIVEAYNTTCPNVLNYPVVVGYDRYQAAKSMLCVLASRIIPVAGSNNSNLYTNRPHHASHEWMNEDGGTDIVYIQNRQMMALRPTPLGNWYFYIHADIQLINGVPQQVGGQTYYLYNRRVSSNTYSVYGDAMYVLVSLDTTSGSIVFTNGSLKAVQSLALSDIPAIPANNLPICAIRFWTGQSDIVEAISQTDLVDLRYMRYATGGGSGSTPYPMARQTVDAGETLTIPSDYCYIVGRRFNVNGRVTVNGELLMIG